MKTTMKRLIAMLLCLMMLMGALPTAVLAAESSTLPELGNGTALAELPKEIVDLGIGNEHIYDFGVDDFTVTTSYHTNAVEDAASALKKAVAIDYSWVSEANTPSFQITDTKPMTIRNTGSENLTELYASDFTVDNSYHVYKLSGVNTDNSVRFFDGSLQLDLAKLGVPGGLITDLYFSMRIEGRLDFENRWYYPAYYIDRMILIVSNCTEYITDADYAPAEPFTCAKDIQEAATCPICDKVYTRTMENSRLAHTPQYDENTKSYYGTTCAVCKQENVVFDYDTEYGTLPEELAAMLSGIGAEHVIREVTADEFVAMEQYDYIERVTDKESAVKRAVAVDYSKVTSNHASFKITTTKPMTVRNTGSENMKPVLFDKKMNESDDYHVYEMTGINVDSALRFFDGSVQVDLPALNLGLSKKIVKVYVSMKVDGKLDYENKDNYPTYYIDRIWIVNSCQDYLTPADYKTLVSPATCTENEVKSATCRLCGMKHEKEMTGTMLDHDKKVVLPRQEPTCTATGLTEGAKCSACGTVTVEQEEIAKISHTYGAPYLKDGKYVVNCKVCKNAEEPYTAFYAKLPDVVRAALGKNDMEKYVHVHDYNIGDMVAPAEKIIADEKALDGKAVCYNVADYSELEQNLYFHFGKGDPMPITALGGKVIASIPAEALKMDGNYYVYELADVKLPADFAGLYLFDTTLQNHFADQSDLSGKTVNLYISMKIVAEKNVPTHYYVDRMLVVDLCKYYVESYTSNNDATCESDGTETGICTKCGQPYTRTEEDTQLPHAAEGKYFYNPTTKLYEASCSNGCGGRAAMDFDGSLPANMLKDLNDAKVGLEHIYPFYADDEDVFDAMTWMSHVDQEDGVVRFNYTDATAASKRYFDNKTITNGGQTLAVADFIEDGQYHTYKLSSVNISEDIVFFDETLSVRFTDLYKWGNKLVDVYFSMKVEEGEKTYYSINRVYVIGACTGNDDCHCCEDFLYVPECVSTNEDSYGELVISADGTTVTLKAEGEIPMLTSSESPVGRAGYWIGFKVTAPETVDETKVVVKGPEETVYKLYEVKDGENPVYANFYKNVEAGTTYTYQIDWDGNESYDLKVVIDTTKAILGENTAAAMIGETQYASFADAYTAAVEDATVTLLKDVTLEEIFSIEKKLTIDLNGKNITGQVDGENGMLYVAAAGDLTVTGDGEIVNTVEEGAEDVVYAIVADGKLTVNNGTVNTLWSCGETTVNGGEIGKLYYNGIGKVTKAETVDLEAPEGYRWYNNVLISADYVAMVGETLCLTLADTQNVAEDGATITLLKDITLEARLDVIKNVIINLNGYNITGQVDDQFGMIYVEKGAELTVTGEGKIVNDGEVAEDGFKFAIGNYGLLTIAGGEISGTDAAVYNFYYTEDYKGTLVVNGGALDTVWNASNATVNGGEIAYIDSSNALTVNGGTIAELAATTPNYTDESVVAINGGEIGVLDYDGTSVVTKAETVELTAPEGYFWSEEGVLTEKSTYTVTFDAANGTEAVRTDVEKETAVAEPAAPEKDGYRFDGWYLDDELYDFSAPVTGNITLTAQWTELKTWYGTNIDMANALDINFYFKKSFAADTGYVEIIRERAGVADEPVIIPLTEVTINGGYYQITYTGLAGKEMTDLLHVTIYDADGNQISVTKSESVQTYAMRMLSNEKVGAKQKTLFVDMLNYGAAAQDNFDDYNITNLANGQLTEEQKALGTQEMAEVKNYQTKEEGKSFYGSNLDLSSRITLNLYFKAKLSGEGAYLMVSYIDHLEKLQEFRVDPVQNGSYHQFHISETVVADGRRVLTCELYSADGTLVETVTESMESYVARVSGSNPWLKTVMCFSDSAYASLH